MKTYTVKSRFRFTIFVTILIILAVTSFNLLFNTTDVADGHTEESYMTIEVVAGDTIWDIVSDYMTGYSDQREAAYELCELNNIHGYEITPGQKIKVPQK